MRATYDAAPAWGIRYGINVLDTRSDTSSNLFSAIKARARDASRDESLLLAAADKVRAYSEELQHEVGKSMLPSGPARSTANREEVAAQLRLYSTKSRLLERTLQSMKRRVSAAITKQTRNRGIEGQMRRVQQCLRLKDLQSLANMLW